MKTRDPVVISEERYRKQRAGKQLAGSSGYCSLPSVLLSFFSVCLFVPLSVTSVQHGHQALCEPIFLLTPFFLFNSIQARLLARQYKELNEKDMRKWEKKAEQDKMRYQEEMKHYIPAEDPTGGKKGKKQKKDPNAPKRNMSAYFLYSIDARPTVKIENPEASFGDIARLISQKFKALTAKERKIWDDKAVADKVRYTAEMIEYKN